MVLTTRCDIISQQNLYIADDEQAFFLNGRYSLVKIRLAVAIGEHSRVFHYIM